MNDQSQFLVFEISGKAEIQVPEIPVSTAQPGPSADEPSEAPLTRLVEAIRNALGGASRRDRETKERGYISVLNENADEAAEKIEREIKRVLPTNVSVQASIQFDHGSILMAGTVALLSWGGAIVLDAAKDEVKEWLRNVVKTAVRRVISQMFVPLGLGQQIGSMQISVTPQVSAASSAPPTQSQPTQTESPPPAERVTSAVNRTNTAVRALIIVTGLLVILQIILLADRFLVIQLKP